MRVVAKIDSDASKIVDTGFRCGGLVPFPIRDGDRNATPTPMTVNASCEPTTGRSGSKGVSPTAQRYTEQPWAPAVAAPPGVG
jgi:hypothetical protein